MSVSSLSPTGGSQLHGASNVSSTTDVTASSTLPVTGGGSTVSSASDAGSASVSDKARLLKQLKELSQSNPAEFKQATAAIAAQLGAAAQQAPAGQGKALSALAAKFQQASQTGSVSALHPAKRHHGGHKGIAATAASAYQNAGALGASGASGTGAQADSIIGSVLSQNGAAGAGLNPTSNLFRPATALA